MNNKLLNGLLLLANIGVIILLSFMSSFDYSYKAIGTEGFEKYNFTKLIFLAIAILVLNAAVFISAYLKNEK